MADSGLVTGSAAALVDVATYTGGKGQDRGLF